MNLKHYLRGLGTGVLVTAVIMGISLGSNKETLSNEEIKEKARALGMTEESVVLSKLEATPSGELSDAVDASPAIEETPTIEPTYAEPTPTIEPDSIEPMPTIEPVHTAEPTPTVIPTASPMPPSTAGMGLPAEDVAEVTIKINSGDGSYTVCARLEEAGLISSAAEYDAYLCRNGYDKKLRVGSHTIPAGADEETIARILSGA